MLYYLFEYLDSLDFPGAGMFQYVMFRSAMAFIFSLLIGIFVGRKIINKLQKRQVGERSAISTWKGNTASAGLPPWEGSLLFSPYWSLPCFLGSWRTVILS